MTLINQLETTMTPTTYKHPRTGTAYHFPRDARRYAALVDRLNEPHACEHGHTDCAAWDRGPCSDEHRPAEDTDEAAAPRLTENERGLLLAIRHSDYHDGRDPVGNPVWVETSCEGYGTSAGGVMASLTTKGLAGTDGEACWITQAGIDALDATEPTDPGPMTPEQQVDHLVDAIELINRHRHDALGERAERLGHERIATRQMASLSPSGQDVIAAVSQRIRGGATPVRHPRTNTLTPAQCVAVRDGLIARDLVAILTDTAQGPLLEVIVPTDGTRCEVCGGSGVLMHNAAKMASCSRCIGTGNEPQRDLVAETLEQHAETARRDQADRDVTAGELRAMLSAVRDHARNLGVEVGERMGIADAVYYSRLGHRAYKALDKLAALGLIELSGGRTNCAITRQGLAAALQHLTDQQLDDVITATAGEDTEEREALFAERRRRVAAAKARPTLYTLLQAAQLGAGWQGSADDVANLLTELGLTPAQQGDDWASWRAQWPTDWAEAFVQVAEPVAEPVAVVDQDTRDRELFDERQAFADAQTDGADDAPPVRDRHALIRAGDGWDPVDFMDIRAGDVYVLIESDGTLVDGGRAMRAVRDAYEADGRGVVDSEPVEDACPHTDLVALVGATVAHCRDCKLPVAMLPSGLDDADDADDADDNDDGNDNDGQTPDEDPHPSWARLLRDHPHPWQLIDGYEGPAVDLWDAGAVVVDIVGTASGRVWLTWEDEGGGLHRSELEGDSYAPNLETGHGLDHALRLLNARSDGAVKRHDVGGVAVLPFALEIAAKRITNTLTAADLDELARRLVAVAP